MSVQLLEERKTKQVPRGLMKANVFRAPGKFGLEEKPICKAGPGEAVIQVRLTTICGTDIHVIRGEYPVPSGLTGDVFTSLPAQGRQIFVADDAIGSINLNPSLADAWSRDLPGVLRKLDADHVLIWTARHYILEEALAESRLGKNVGEFPGPREVLVEVGEPLRAAEGRNALQSREIG